jgi:glycerol-3-phosphate acyltransferase PlsY
MVYRSILAVVVAYFVGSLPFAYVIGRWRGGVDIRYVGEGSVGSRNVVHVIGPGWGAVVGILDVVKGCLAFLLARQVGAPLWGVLASGFAVTLGHGFPVFLRGRGGKGVSVSAAYVLALAPYSFLVGAVAFGLSHLVLRDFNKTVVVGVVAMVFSPPLLGYGWWVAPYALGLFLLVAAKKAIDRPHEQRVWAERPWLSGDRPGFHVEKGEGD